MSSTEPVWITFQIPPDQKAELERIAAEDDRSVSAVLRILVRELVAQRQEKVA
jgi:hypothetical protein